MKELAPPELPPAIAPEIYQAPEVPAQDEPSSSQPMTSGEEQKLQEVPEEENEYPQADHQERADEEEMQRPY